MKRKNTEDPLFKLHRKNHQHEPDNLDLTKKLRQYMLLNIYYRSFIFIRIFIKLKPAESPFPFSNGAEGIQYSSGP